MTTQPRICILIPTHDRKDILQETLRRLAAQTCPPDLFEVIVIDGGSEDGTDRLMASLAGSFPYRLKSLRQGNLGPGSNRNLGIRHAEAEILLFINDDVLPAPDFVQRHLEYHEKWPEAHWAVLGRVVQDPGVQMTPFSRFFEPFAFSTIGKREELDFRYFWTCNLSVKRSFLLQHGIFSESVRYPAHEDVELGYRLEQKGLRIRYCPEALGHHHHFMTFERECKHQYEMGYYFHLLWKNVRDWRLYEWIPLICWQMPRPLLAKRLARHAARLILFNRLTVPLLFEPLIAVLEQRPGLARHARILYWKVLTYYARRGIADGLRARSVTTVLNLFAFERKGAWRRANLPAPGRTQVRGFALARIRTRGRS